MSAGLPKFNAADLLPLAAKLGSYVKLGVEHYGAMRAAGLDVTPELLAGFLSAKMDGWNPKVSDRKLLDPATKQAGARFLSGIVFNLAGGQDE